MHLCIPIITCSGYAVDMCYLKSTIIIHIKSHFQIMQSALLIKIKRPHAILAVHHYSHWHSPECTLKPAVSLVTEYCKAAPAQTPTHHLY